MAANTDFKLTWLDNTEVFTFPSGWKPSNENLSPVITGEEINLSYNNIMNKFSYGLGKNQIVLQGDQLDDNDRWKLSSAIADRRLKKLWLGEDWYFYVLGVEPRKMRDDSLPSMAMYTAAFEALDPFYYESNDSTPRTTSARYWDASTEDDVEKNRTIDVTDATLPNNTTFIEPIFWVTTQADATVSRLRIRDETNRRLDVTYAQGGSELWLIMPYLKTSYEGFLTEGPVAIKTRHTPVITTNYGLDLPIYLDYRGGTLYLDHSSLVRANLEFVSDSAAWKMNRKYPRLEDDENTTIYMKPSMGSSGAIDNVQIEMQYLLRRI